ncbi:unnamed protein product [Pleuronectes platessa]|uniref:Uncharacterized protein n=1 Tax=Pleuronectes platessa TaxID=8262 RepID=A0A9N7TP76_PLEPL|nr:unnamed protein product [Pleuronectes platessa]
MCTPAKALQLASTADWFSDSPCFVIHCACSPTLQLFHEIERDKRKGDKFQRNDKKANSIIEVKTNDRTAHVGRSEVGTPGRKVEKKGSQRISLGPRSDISCTRVGGVCQPKRHICQGRHLRDECSGAKCGAQGSVRITWEPEGAELPESED